MTPRSREILHEIVEAYIAKGEPVASRSIARRWHDNLSAASIRNTMADLADEGFLSQPHTSAGRVPTEKAFRSYIESLTLRKMAVVEIERLRAEIGSRDTVEARVEHTSRMLVQMTHGVGIAAAIPKASPALDQIELVGLPGGRVLMVVVTQDQQVRNRIVTLDEPLTTEELISIRNYINRNFSGKMLEEIRRELAARLDHAAAAYDALLKKLTVLYSKGLLDLASQPPEVHMEGASNLFAVEQKKRILDLLDRFLEQPAGAIGVQVGLGEVHPSMGQLSLIGVPVALPNGISAVIAVLGPMRMNYGRVMSAVQHVGQAFQTA